MWSRTILLIAVSFCGSLYPSAPTHESEDVPVVFTKTAKPQPLFDMLLYPVRIQSQINATVVAEADAIVTKVVAPLGKTVGLHAPVLILKHIDPVYHYRPLVIPAPVAGVVSSMEVSQGTRVTKGQKLASIMDPKQLSAIAEIASGDLASIQLGLTAEMKLNGSSKPYSVTVIGVSPQLDPVTGTATCLLALENRDVTSVPSGSLGKVTFKVRERRAIAIPEHALVYRENQVFVRIVVNNTARFIPVNVGTSRGGIVEITSGIEDGMSVILRSSVYVAQGERVKVQPAESAEFE